MDKKKNILKKDKEIHSRKVEASLRSALSFSSEALLQQAIAGLLTRMPNINGVQILQGTQELGKDIIFYIPGGFGEIMLCACVVKNTKITGDVSRSSGARTILFQAQQAFDSTHTDSLERLSELKEFILSPHLNYHRQQWNP